MQKETVRRTGNDTLSHTATDGRSAYSVGANRAVRVVLADMDQDGFNDIITSNHGMCPGDGSISVLINKLLVSTGP